MSYQTTPSPTPAPAAKPSGLLGGLEADYARLSVQLRTAIADAIKVGVGVAAALGIAGVTLSSLHVPGVDTALVSAAAGVITGAISWLGRHGFSSTAKP